MYAYTCLFNGQPGVHPHTTAPPHLPGANAEGSWRAYSGWSGCQEELHYQTTAKLQGWSRFFGHFAFGLQSSMEPLALFLSASLYIYKANIKHRNLWAFTGTRALFVNEVAP